jgi:hypothetical protein
MSSRNRIYREFHVLSTQPNLRIRYSKEIWIKIALLPFFFLCSVFFIAHGRVLLYGLYEILHLRLWQALKVLSYNTGSFWSVPTFFFAFSGLGAIFWYMLWFLLGVSEINATCSSLTIRYELLGLSRKVSLPVNDIEYFSQFVKENGDGHTWDLEVVTNQKYFKEDRTFAAWIPAKNISEDMLVRLNYKTIHLYTGTDSSLSEWLGNTLANFYRVRFQSVAQSNNRAAPER